MSYDRTTLVGVEKHRRTLSKPARLIAALVILTAAAQATTIADFTGALTASDATQTGRLSRNGVPTDWSSDPSFPGTINTGTQYHYEAFIIPIASEWQRYVEITFIDWGFTGNLFASAYNGSYSPSGAGPYYGLDVNYLGDAGSSGYFGDPYAPASFQVYLPSGLTSLVLVVNETTASAGLNVPFEFVVNLYQTSDYYSAPEPSSAAIFLGGGLLLAGIGLMRRRKLHVSVKAARNAAIVAALVAVVSLPAFSQTDPGITADGMKQISDLLNDKAAALKANPKLDVNLYFASKLAQGQLSGKSYVNAAPAFGVDASGMATVVIRGTFTSALQSQIAGLGGKVLQLQPQFGYARVLVPASALQSLSSVPGVTKIGQDRKARTNTFGAGERVGASLDFALRRAMSPKGFLPFVGALTSQGAVSHRANQVWPLGITGAGVRVGVLSDSASPATVAALIATGDLPADVVVVPGQEGSGEDEGTAMMEIVHDIAPNAKLYFATAFNGEESFADNIRTLRFTYGCDIIVDDVTYYDEGAFQDGLVAKAVNDVVADGGMYFSSAANSGNQSRGTSGTWEGDFVNGGAVSGVVGSFEGTGYFHNFLGTTPGQNYNAVTSTASGVFSLKWSDPLGASSNDYDLIVLNSAGTRIKAYSASAQDGTQDPFEILGYTPAVNDRIVVVQYAGVGRAMHLDTNRGNVSIHTTGSTYGHNAGKNTVSMAAVYWNSGMKGAQPFVGGATNPIESFSSDGPRRIFYEPDGTPITSGNVLFGTSGGELLLKPDFAAADGVYTKTPGFLPFFGTSAAAPHAAGIAALVKSAVPTYTNTQIYNALKATAMDNMATGPDRDSGYGILNALNAVKYAQAHRTPPAF